MAVAYVNETTSTTLGTGNTQGTINVPSGASNGNLLVCAVQTGSASSAFTLSGWTTMIASWTDSNDSAGACFYRIASSEPASYTVTWTTAASDLILTMKNFSGVNTSTPIRSSRIDHAGATGASYTTTALTGTQSTDMTVQIAQMGDDNGVTTYTVTKPGSPWTSIDGFLETAKYTGSVYATGSQSGATWTSSSSFAYWNVTTFAIEAGTTGSNVLVSNEPTYIPTVRSSFF
jgi:hypothetical protein